MKQKDALKILKAGKNVYLTGAAGSGKTYVLNEYISYLKNRGARAAVTASTGIAATHIGGVTIHSWSGAGIKDDLNDEDIERLIQKEYLYKKFEKTKVLIIDEVSMLSSRLFDSVERVCRAMKRSEEPFGGMQVVLSGDFFQLPPITKEGGNADFIHSSEAWNKMDVRICYLSEQFRQKDSSLEKILNEMRQGGISPASKNKLAEICENNSASLKSASPTRLYTHNIDVDAENERELEKLEGKARVYEMSAGGKASMVESLKKGILAPETLRLKKGAAVMFVKNAFDEGYANGTLGKVKDFDNEGMPIVRTFSGDMIRVTLAKWTVEEDEKVLARVEQLPLRLAWAITVHKSQGMSLDAAEIDLSKAFVPGQGYVALSRLRDFAGLSLRGLNDMAFMMHPRAMEVDARLLAESAKWEKVLERFSDKEMNEMHIKFLKKIGGMIDEKEIARNTAKNKDKKEAFKEKISTYEKTLALVFEKMSLAEIAKKRGMALGTIISHLEKLKEKNPALDLNAYKPKERDFKIISDAFKKVKETKLAPVYEIIGGKYSYEELRLARLFLSSI
ncbi:MAG: helicase [Candidatus Terrybacteria bacterium CG10_big_fil_rev_8_21_14_0_10_41_10]|uniref:Helicase n=1 Tax=Candidatus Terrybacteria bacterium CG10_big_fil_rev_8_21_14_0_10_41_10 TaxID=1975026 RepID=A0A2M8LC07_9BACT|nr:MAG: helicase [Candidatus Terrybacteria bacterium CG10_big_fil_rev_8_21_14_0_10_41_10]